MIVKEFAKQKEKSLDNITITPNQIIYDNESLDLNKDFKFYNSILGFRLCKKAI